MMIRVVLLTSFTLCYSFRALATDFDRDVRPVLMKYCAECHSGDDANGEVDFSGVKTNRDIEQAYEIWESVAGHLQNGSMPPGDEPRPNNQERDQVLAWYQNFVSNIEARPAIHQPRRLSVTEYRNTLRSVLGFDLQVDVIEAEQTVTEKSMVVKLLPIDPPGKSGFKNDTHTNPLTTVVWDQYAYLADAALEELFLPEHQLELQALSGSLADPSTNSPDVLEMTVKQAQQLMRKFVPLAYRRGVANEDIEKITNRLVNLKGHPLIAALKFEMKSVLMSPAFIYRGLLLDGERDQQQVVDPFEFAERLSYFLWADMPDERLMALATDGTLSDSSVYAAEIDRMLASPKSRSLAEVFAVEWLTLNEIEFVSNNPPQMEALRSQPIDFMHYLFTENRPLLELIDSDTTFINPHTSRMYGRDAKQMTKYVKQRGIEVEIVPNQKIQLEATTERGGILTMPGILAMNRGPVLRGTWILERIVGHELPDPPANVGAVPPNKRGENLAFRERFSQHRADPTCAVCHDKIDPLGFALESFSADGKFVRNADYKPSKKEKKAGAQVNTSKIDTSGRLPTGETFDDINGLKSILASSQREAVVRNIVERTLSYALCRKLQLFDQPSVDTMVDQMMVEGATWRDLVHAIAASVPFRETILSP